MFHWYAKRIMSTPTVSFPSVCISAHKELRCRCHSQLDIPCIRCSYKGILISLTLLNCDWIDPFFTIVDLFGTFDVIYRDTQLRTHFICSNCCNKRSTGRKDYTIIDYKKVLALTLFEKNIF